MNDEIPKPSSHTPVGHLERRTLMPPRRPLGSTLVAWGFVLISVLAIGSMVRHLLHGRVSFHFGVLLFPVALGLFNGRVSAILWARVQGGFMVALGGLTLLLYPFFGAGYNVHLFGLQLHGWQRLFLAAGVCSAIICLGIAIWRAVGSRAHLAYVDAQGGFLPFLEPDINDDTSRPQQSSAG